MDTGTAISMPFTVIVLEGYSVFTATSVLGVNENASGMVSWAMAELVVAVLLAVTDELKEL